MSTPALAVPVVPALAPRAVLPALRRAGHLTVACARMALALLRWACRHFAWTAAAVGVGGFAYLSHWPLVVVLAVAWVLIPAAVSVEWSRRAPVSYEHCCAAPWRQHVWRSRHRRSWRATSEALGLGRHVTRTRTRKDGAQVADQVWKPARCRVRTTPLGLALEVATPLGLSVEQVITHGEALASAAGAYSVRSRRVSPSLCRFDLAMVNALAVPRLALDPATTGPVVLGRCEDGTELTWSPYTDAHIAIQGMTRSGKSALSYTLLAALAGRSDVLVCGVDPSGILLGPWEHEGRAAGWTACGATDFTRARAALSGIVTEMDRRIERLRACGLDKLETYSADCPALVVVLEEWPGTQAACQAEDKATGRTGADALLPAIERSVGRLIKEGAKVGVRVVVIAQRMSATALSTDDRANISLRITLRVDNADAIRMLHDGAELAAREVREFAPGCAVVEGADISLQRARADLTTFATYRRRVAAGVARAGLMEPSASAAAPVPVAPVATHDVPPLTHSRPPEWPHAPDTSPDGEPSVSGPACRPSRPRQSKRPRQAAT